MEDDDETVDTDGGFTSDLEELDDTYRKPRKKKTQLDQVDEEDDDETVGEGNENPGEEGANDGGNGGDDGESGQFVGTTSHSLWFLFAPAFLPLNPLKVIGCDHICLEMDTDTSVLVLN